jgi:hypothetical protein
MIVVKTIKTYESDKSYDFYRLKEDSWSGALQTLEDIENANMEEEFMEHLDQIFGYEEEIEDVTLNDYIWFERDSIYQSLGLNENGELIEESEV